MVAKIRLFVVGTCILCLTGCTSVMTGLYGIHPFDRDVTPKELERLANRMKISEQEDLVLSLRYGRHLDAVRDTLRKKTWNGMHQPLQLRWYSKGGRLQWIVPNCDVGGFPNLQWSHFGLPDTLVVDLANREYADSAWTIADDFNFMTVRSTGQIPARMPGADGYLLVYWTYYMGRQSVRLSRYIRKWHKHHGRSIEVRYVNADSLLMGWDRPEVAL